MRQYHVTRNGEKVDAKLVASIGDTTETGALRVVESIWGDPENDRLLIAEEDESYASEFKVYTLAGRFTGTTFYRDVFKAQAEGVALRTCGKDGWWITTEQGKQRSVFHLFDRHTLKPVGAFQGNTVANTDGIWMMQQASTRFPTVRCMPCMTTRAWWRSTGRASPSNWRCRWSVAHEPAARDAHAGPGSAAGAAVAVVRGG